MSGRGPRWFTGIKPNTVTITMTGVDYTYYAHVTINGIEYAKSATVEVAPGTIIYAYVHGLQRGGEVYLNGTLVASGYNTTYEYTVNDPTTIKMTRPGSGNATYRGQIDITTE